MSNLTIQQAFDLAVQHHQAGQFAIAEELYGKILEVVPKHPDALHHLGVLASQRGRNDLAVEYITQALGHAPQLASAHSNLGLALIQLGKFEPAIEALHKALDLQPDFPEAMNNLGNALFDLRRYDEAEVALQRALLLRPGFPQSQVKLLDLWVQTRRLDEALALVREVLAERPACPGTLNALGSILAAQGKLDEALVAYTKALEAQAAQRAVQFDRGNMLNNRGNVLKQLGRPAEAAAAYREALALNPGNAGAHNNLGLVLAVMGEVDDAVVRLRQALRLEKRIPLVHSNLANLLKDVGQHAEALALYREGIEVDATVPDPYSNLLLALHYVAGQDPEEVFAEHLEWGRRHAEPWRESILPHSNPRDPERRLRIGYLSADMCDHPVGRLLLPVFQNHDAAQVNITVYSGVPIEDDLTKQLREHASEWRSVVGMEDAQVADTIRADAIDILIELSGHTAGHRLLVFARKPAPVQVSYLGYPDTTGVAAIDYRFTDSLADPPGCSVSRHVEELVRLDPCAWCFAPLPEIAPVVRGMRPFTFGSYNVTAKVTDEMLRVWARILRGVPESHLLLKGFGWKSKAATRRVLALMAAEGVDAGRIELRGQHPTRLEHLASHRHLDIALDTFPYHGTNMTFEALWMGTPVITLAGQTHASRVGVSLLTHAGHPEWVAASEDEYVAKAVELASQPERLAQLRVGLRDELRASPVMDGAGMARRIEAAYRTMWRKWCATAPADEGVKDG